MSSAFLFIRSFLTTSLLDFSTPYQVALLFLTPASAFLFLRSTAPTTSLTSPVFYQHLTSSHLRTCTPPSLIQHVTFTSGTSHVHTLKDAVRSTPGRWTNVSCRRKGKLQEMVSPFRGSQHLLVSSSTRCPEMTLLPFSSVSILSRGRSIPTASINRPALAPCGT